MHPSGSSSKTNIDPNDPGTGGGTVDFNGSDGLPVYSLTAGQAQYLTNGIQPLAGVTRSMYGSIQPLQPNPVLWLTHLMNWATETGLQ